MKRDLRIGLSQDCIVVPLPPHSGVTLAPGVPGVPGAGRARSKKGPKFLKKKKKKGFFKKNVFFQLKLQFKLGLGVKGVPLKEWEE